MQDAIRIARPPLEYLTEQVLVANGMSQADAHLASQVLIAADERGIPSHGLARLPRYIKGLRELGVSPDAKPTILRETPISLAIDANNAMGTTVSHYAMQQVIEKANKSGAGLATVCNSNHFGIAGWYAMQALSSDLIGITMTNTTSLGLPTFGRKSMFGTNPIAFAAPADKEQAFVLDMATTAVARGKIEVYARQDKALPVGWAAGHDGQTIRDASTLLTLLSERSAGGLHPLGGEGEASGGHKGYGLAIMVDILCGVLAGNTFGQHIVHSQNQAGNVGHFFAAFQIELFRDKCEFKQAMDQLLSDLRHTPPMVGQDRVWYAGLKEFEAQQAAAQYGVPLEQKVMNSLVQIAKDYQINVDLTASIAK